MSNIVLARLGENIKASTAGQIATSSGSTTAPALVDSTLSFRNKLVNGNMRNDQRNEGNIVNLNQTIGRRFICDRWAANIQATSTAAQADREATGPNGFPASLRFIVTTPKSPSTLEYNVISQTIEGFNVTDLAWGTADAKPTALSFWVRSSLTGQFGGSVRGILGSWPIPPVTNVNSFPFTYNINQANTWEYKTILIPPNTSATINVSNDAAIDILFDIGSGSSFMAPAANQWYTNANYHNVASSVKLIQTNAASFFITGVQFERGPYATPFEQRLNNVENNLCLRYFEKNTFAKTIGIFNNIISAWTIVRIPFMTPKRNTPTITTNQAGNNFAVAQLESSTPLVLITGFGFGIQVSGSATTNVRSINQTEYYVDAEI